MKKQNHLILSAVFLFLLFIIQGCKKDSASLPKPLATMTQADTSQYVLGYHGLIPKSHIIGEGYKLVIKGGHVYKAETATNNLVEDFGEIHFPPAGAAVKNNTAVTSTTPRPIQEKSGNLKFGGSYNWLGAEQWVNPNGGTINYFSATCVVPPLPSSAQNQAYGIWIGLSPDANGNGPSGASYILQPILAYGDPAGNNGYTVFNYFIWGNGVGDQAMTTPESVSVGTNIKYVIQYTTGTYDYQLQILNASTGLALTPNLPVTNADGEPIPAMNYATVVAEIPTGAPEITSLQEYPYEPANYPNSADAVISNIALSYGNPTGANYPATIGWNLVSVSGNSLGETATVPSNNNNNAGSPGTIDLWFGQAPPTTANFTCISNASQTVAILFESTTSSYTYNALIGPGSSSFQLPVGTYNVIFNSPGGAEYEEIIPNAGTPGTTASNFSGSQVYQVNNIPYSIGYYTVTVGNNGD